MTDATQPTDPRPASPVGGEAQALDLCGHPRTGAAPLEIAYGCLWRTITDDHKLNVIRNELRQCLTDAQQRRGVAWAVNNLPEVTETEIARVDL